ncbi:PREDICTED: uncharacterized protein LOC109171920 [Ipomoea nil]|uniref:uncharacterized protein LOC109171920 n=1 Tax=Ipomoea nil TaxID=35883 RepID=UPI0009017406|nr:PREDICTED: uncharacterized protein LOC109171920 [Ipomoea nil]
MKFPREGLSNTEGIQCYECKGFGHIQSECPTYFKRKNKTYVTTLSDDSNSEEDTNTNFVAFTTNHENDNGNENDIQELLESYTQLHAKWEQIIKVNLELIHENQFLKDEKESNEKRLKDTHNELMESKGREAKLLQEIKALTERPRSPNPASNESHSSEIPEVSQHHFQHRKRIRCYYCHRLGHIKAYCFKRQNDLYYRQINRDWSVQSKKIWVRKDQNVAYTSKTSKEQNVWYFDSGCSRHMTGNPENLENIQYKNKGHITFGDGGKGQIIASGILNVHGLPRLPKVLLVQSLKTNLISISQLCEDELKITNKQKQSRHQHMRHINSHDIKGDLEIFLDYSGYSSNSKTFSVDSTMESMNVVINDTISRIITNDDESPRVVETTVLTPLTTVMQNHKTETEPDEKRIMALQRSL